MKNDIETTNLRLLIMISIIKNIEILMKTLTRRNSLFSKQAACTCFQTLWELRIIVVSEEQARSINERTVYYPLSLHFPPHLDSHLSR